MTSTGAMGEEVRRVVLVGRAGSGRSTLASMLVSGEPKLERPASPPIRTTRVCKTYEGRGWAIVDSVGFGEPLSPAVSGPAAKLLVIDFLKDVKGRYSHIIFVHEKGRRVDKVSKLVWETFCEMFSGGEERFVVLLTKVDDPTWLSENRASMEKAFPGCKRFLSVNFPGIAADADPETEELNTRTRKEELERLEKQLKLMFQVHRRAEPHIYWMGDEGIEQKAVGILRRISSGKLKMKETTQTQPLYAEHAAALESSVHELNDVKNKLREISRIQNEMQNLWGKVKVHRCQCEYLYKRSCEASTLIRDLCNESKLVNLFLPPLISSLDCLVSAMNAGKELLRICGDCFEQDVALTLSSPAPYRDSFSKFALVLRDLDWSLDVSRFLLHHRIAASADTWDERQSWLSMFSWCEDRCRLVWVGGGETKPAVSDAGPYLQADKDRQAVDRRELLSFLDSVVDPEAPRSGSPLLPCVNFSIRSSKYKCFLRERLRRGSSFCDPVGIPDCFLIPEKLDYKIDAHIGVGSFKAVHKCKWLEKEVAIATISGSEDSFRTALMAEAGLLARAQHPNVISFYGYTYDEEEQKGFFVIELMETDLRKLINSQNRSSGSPFPLPVSIDILLQIVEAMIHVHGCGVIHRDLKAQNCLVKRNFKGGKYVVKLIDFGESKLGSHFKTRNRGTPAWMAPEVIGDDHGNLYTYSADVYSFAVTCHEILTGLNRPYGDLKGRDLVAEVRAGRRPAIPDDCRCPPELVNLMTKCWAPNPEDRPTFMKVREILWDFKLYFTLWGTVGARDLHERLES